MVLQVASWKVTNVAGQLAIGQCFEEVLVINDFAAAKVQELGVRF